MFYLAEAKLIHVFSDYEDRYDSSNVQERFRNFF